MPLTVLFRKRYGRYAVTLTAHTPSEYNYVNRSMPERRRVQLTHSKTGRRIAGIVLSRRMRPFSGASRSTKLSLTLLPCALL